MSIATTGRLRRRAAPVPILRAAAARAWIGCAAFALAAAALPGSAAAQGTTSGTVSGTTSGTTAGAAPNSIQGAAPGGQQGDAQPPLVIQSQGSFFVGGEERTSHDLVGSRVAGSLIGPDGTYTANQMYVHYQIPPEVGAHVPIVLIHGCCLTGKTWETTPDGRMGWDEYFVRQHHPVYVIDQVARGRSAIDATAVNEVAHGKAPMTALPNFRFASHEGAWQIFRFGPSYRETFPGLQFPVEAVGEFWKQMSTDLNASLPDPNPTLFDLSALSVRLRGAVLVSHSQSGPFPFQTAMISPQGIAGIISIEPGSCDGLAPGIPVLAKIPSVVVFGDYLGGFANWASALKSCQAFAKQVRDAGGDMQVLQLPEAGIYGNSHMLMQDRNNIQVADLLLKWIAEHVERRS